jgi:hypothetical protein
MSAQFKIASEAQRQMFEKAAADPEYAKSRNISQEMAQQYLDGHKAAGSPKLPERAKPPMVAPRTSATKSDRPKFLGSMRE